jgi:hypothetical protein
MIPDDNNIYFRLIKFLRVSIVNDFIIHIEEA